MRPRFLVLPHPKACTYSSKSVAAHQDSSSRSDPTKYCRVERYLDRPHGSKGGFLHCKSQQNFRTSPHVPRVALGFQIQLPSPMTLGLVVNHGCSSLPCSSDPVASASIWTKFTESSGDKKVLDTSQIQQKIIAVNPTSASAARRPSPLSPAFHSCGISICKHESVYMLCKNTSNCLLSVRNVYQFRTTPLGKCPDCAAITSCPTSRKQGRRVETPDGIQLCICGS